MGAGWSMPAAEARRRVAAARVARLATADAEGVPHLVPLVFALEGDVIYSAVDAKPKRSAALRRLANVGSNPAVALLVDHYDDGDWSALWWVRAEGRGRVLPAPPPGAAVAGGMEDPTSLERRRALELLRRRYPQYRTVVPAGAVLAIDVARWSGWAAVEP